MPKFTQAFGIIAISTAFLASYPACAQVVGVKEYIKQSGKTIAIENTTGSGGACAAAPSALPFRSTGNDQNGQLITVSGTIDPNWKLVSSPSVNFGGPTMDQARVSPTWGVGSTATSAFIRQVSASANVPPGYYVYRQRLDLSCYDPATVVISGSVIADDRATIFLNGRIIGSEFGNWDVDAPFSIQNSPYFIKGWNDIDFAIRNTGSGDNPEAFRVTIATATATKDAAANGAKVLLSSDSGSQNMGNSSGVSSDQPVNWSLWGDYAGQSGLNAVSSVSATYTSTYSGTALKVVPVKGELVSNAAVYAVKALYFQADKRAEFLSSTPSLPTSMNSGEQVTLNLRFRNTGLLPWATSEVVLAKANAVNWGTSEVSLPNNVGAGTGEVVIPLTITAPTVTTSQSLEFRWQMKMNPGNFFGLPVAGNITVNPAGSSPVTITPAAPGSLAPYQTLSFSATVTGGTTNNVRWTVLSNSAGTSSNGSFSTGPTTCAASSIYRAPSTVTSAGSITIQAESCDNPSWKRTAAIPVTVGSSVTISIQPRPATVGQSHSFSATVTNADNSAITWTRTPSNAGSIGSTSGAYTAGGYSGTLTVTATSVENPNRSDPLTCTVTGGTCTQSATATSPNNGELVSTMQVAITSNSASEIGTVVMNWSDSSSVNQVPSTAPCRIRYDRNTEPNVVKIERTTGGFVEWMPVVIGSGATMNDNRNCRIVGWGSTISVSADGKTVTLSLKIVNLKITGTRHLWVSTQTPQGTNPCGPMPATKLGNAWTPAPPVIIEFSSSNGGTSPTVPVASQIDLYARVINPPYGMWIQWQPQLPGLEFISNPSPAAGYQYAIRYAATNRVAENFTVPVRFSVRNWDDTDVSPSGDDAVLNVLVTTSSGTPPKLNSFTNPIVGGTDNPKEINTTKVADSVTFHWFNWGVDNRGWNASMCVPPGQPFAGCYNINNLHLNINRTMTEDGSAQNTINGCRIRTNVKNAGGSYPEYRIWLANNDGTQWEYGDISWAPGFDQFDFTLGSQNSQCTVRVRRSNGAYASTPSGSTWFLGVGVEISFKTPFKGQRYLYMMGERIDGAWTAWQYRGFLNLN